MRVQFMHYITWDVFISAGVGCRRCKLDIVFLLGSRVIWQLRARRFHFRFITKSRKSILKNVILKYCRKVIILLIKNQAPHSTVQSNQYYNISAITRLV